MYSVAGILPAIRGRDALDTIINMDAFLFHQNYNNVFLNSEFYIIVEILFLFSLTYNALTHYMPEAYVIFHFLFLIWHADCNSCSRVAGWWSGDVYGLVETNK